MIYDFDDLRKILLPKYLIIGSGPAGITLSRALASHGKESMILEAGGLDFTENVQETAKGEVVGDLYFDLEYSHLKFFGGSSNHWNGFCRHIDAHDFEKRTDIQDHIGWPIGKHDLDPFYQETCEILEVDPMQERQLDESLKEIEFSLSPPVRFSTKYKDFFAKSSRANVCLNSNVTAIAAKNGRVKSITVQGPDKSKLEIQPEIVIFCMGGIDNSRLLLWSNEVSEEPVVKNVKTLGRYWFEHPHNIAGQVDLKKNRGIFDFSSQYNLSFFSPTKQALRKYGILNASLRVQDINVTSSDMKKHTRDLICKSKILTNVAELSMGENLSCTSQIELVWEQEPRRDNRIALSMSERDYFGVPRPTLFWKKSELDYRTAKVMMELYGSYIATNCDGVLESFDHIINEENYPENGWMAGNHHLGGTRMAETAEEGIVDKNLKIFDLNNAYILGSSVFPTGGHANPTFTIVQLALRLGDHFSNKE